MIFRQPLIVWKFFETQILKSTVVGCSRNHLSRIFWYRVTYLFTDVRSETYDYHLYGELFESCQSASIAFLCLKSSRVRADSPEIWFVLLGGWIERGQGLCVDNVTCSHHSYIVCSSQYLCSKVSSVCPSPVDHWLLQSLLTTAVSCCMHSHRANSVRTGLPLQKQQQMALCRHTSLA